MLFNNYFLIVLWPGISQTPVNILFLLLLNISNVTKYIISLAVVISLIYSLLSKLYAHTSARNIDN